MSGLREWVVMLRARSSIRLRGDPHVVIDASPQSTGPVTAVRLRNSYTAVDGNLLVTGLFVEARGQAVDSEAAVETLAGWASPYLQIMATVGHGAVDEPTDLVVYAPPLAGEPGRFVDRRSCGPR